MVKIVKLIEMEEIKEMTEKIEKEHGHCLLSSIDELIEYLVNFDTENIIDDKTDNKNGLMCLVVSYQTLKLLNGNDAECDNYYGDTNLKNSYAVLFERIYESVLTCLHILDYAIVEDDE